VREGYVFVVNAIGGSYGGIVRLGSIRKLGWGEQWEGGKRVCAGLLQR
jgi:hypothetical protein